MKTALQNYFDTLKNKRIYVIGMGVSNMPLIEKMLDAGLDVTACDRRLRSAFDGKIEALEARGLSVCLGDDYLDHLDGAQIIFRTPGMRPDLPQLVAERPECIPCARRRYRHQHVHDHQCRCG